MMNKYHKIVNDILSLAEGHKRMYVQVEILGATHLIDVLDCAVSVDEEGDLIFKQEDDFYGNSSK